MGQLDFLGISAFKMRRQALLPLMWYPMTARVQRFPDGQDKAGDLLFTIDPGSPR